MTTQLVWLATQDVMQVLLVVVCVYAGWSAWSLLLHLLTASRDGKQVSAKLITFDDPKLATTDAEQEEGPADGACSANWDDAEDCVGACGRSILEHYGVFGAAPGTWEGRAKTSHLRAQCDDDSF
mmetsp:Transcript_7777/g.21004  ORF Transcript_7777/g.21004 Transcript_7777/m.21004 type:complete len:125 (+) Transcript_7777:196-570(+)